MSQFVGKHDLDVKSEGEKGKKQRKESCKEPSKSKETKLKERCRLKLEEWNKDIPDPVAYMARLEEYINRKYDEKGLDDPVNLANYESLPFDVPKIQRK